MYNDVCECSAWDTGPPLNEWERVQRWDVYDIADELADLPHMLTEALSVMGAKPFDNRLDAVYSLLTDLEARAWRAADRGGVVGPAPEYLEA